MNSLSLRLQISNREESLDYLEERTLHLEKLLIHFCARISLIHRKHRVLMYIVKYATILQYAIYAHYHSNMQNKPYDLHITTHRHIQSKLF